MDQTNKIITEYENITNKKITQENKEDIIKIITMFNILQNDKEDEFIKKRQLKKIEITDEKVVELFVNECCIIEDKSKTKINIIYNPFYNYTLINNHQIISKNKFGRILRKNHNVITKKSGGVRYHTNIKMK